MLEDGTIKWQGSLRKTYDKYLNPAVLDYDNQEMWEMADNGVISSLFQFDTTTGGQAIRKIKPKNLIELAISNSIMRLMCEEGEQPMDIYVKHRLCPELWYDEMKDAGLNTDEIKVLEKYLLEKCGVADSQEVVMQLSMDPKISGFTMKEANKLRKTIAKKKFKEIEAVRELYYKKGLELGNRKEILDYVWEKQFKLSFGYSFSSIHTTAYSLIALQEMNLAYHYPIIYWNCACLSVDSSAISDEDFYNLIDDDIISVDDNDEDKKVANKMDYAKMAEALSRFKKVCKIDMPDINKSRLSFTPDVETNTILYGLKGICQITDPTIREIMDNRPFNSLQDFLNKITKKTITKSKVINLIKCGAFDKIEHKDRREILRDYLWTTCEPKKKLTMQNAASLIERHLFPKELEYYCDVYNLTKELRKHRDANKIWYCGDRLDIPDDKFDSWKKILQDSKVGSSEIVLNNENRKVIDSSKWDAFYKKSMIPLQAYIKQNHDEMLKALNDSLFEDEWMKYTNDESEDEWELDSMNFFFHNHPLTKVIPQIQDKEEIYVSHLNEIVEGAADGQFIIKGKVIPKMKLYTIAGVVIDRDKVKGLVSLQCPDGVINLKVYKDLYSTMVQVVPKADGSLQESFFEKGVYLLVTGILRGTTFIPKVYKNLKRKPIERINITKNGHLLGLEEKL